MISRRSVLCALPLAGIAAVGWKRDAVIAQIGPEGFGSVVLDGSGNGTVRVGPLTALETWNPANAHVQASTNVKEAVCAIYVGDTPTQSNFRDSTFTGSSGDSTDKIGADIVKSPHKIFAVWTGGDAGARATLQVTGSKNV